MGAVAVHNYERAGRILTMRTNPPSQMASPPTTERRSPSGHTQVSIKALTEVHARCLLSSDNYKFRQRQLEFATDDN